MTSSTSLNLNIDCTGPKIYNVQTAVSQLHIFKITRTEEHVMQISMKCEKDVTKPQISQDTRMLRHRQQFIQQQGC